MESFQSQDTNELHFRPVYVGNGVNHMNINLVDLKLTGLIIGDEIGIFDGVYCVGSSVIQEMDMTQNILSIPASANDTVESSPNGYISGHKIVLKAYRDGTVYPLVFELVENSKDVFYVGGAMFAFVDFNRSTGNETILSSENLKIYPNPFIENINIELSLPLGNKIDCQIFDSSGHPVKFISGDFSGGHKIVVWDGKDDFGFRVPPGSYYIKINNLTKRIILLE